jgi:hypothetical protein
VRNTVPVRQLPFPLEYIVKTIPKPLTAPQPSHPAATAIERGSYLVTLAGCKGCHTPDVQGETIAGMEFGGGGEFAVAEPPIHSLNITPDPSGIAHYDESLFKELMRTGRVAGRLVSHVMPFEFFRNVTDEDLGDIFAFIRQLPPVKHRISNTDPPALCVLCKRTHGLGELNK